MDSNIIFVKTAKGEDEARNKSTHLVGDMRRALLMVDGTATFGEISKRAAPSLRKILDEMFSELEKGGFIRDRNEKARSGHIPKMVVPQKMAAPLKKPADEGTEELDFTAAFRPPSKESLAAEAKKAEAAKLKAEAEARAQQEAARQESEKEAARVRAELEAAKAKAEAEAKARAQIEAKARQAVEAAKLKAQREAEEARLKAEQAATKAREEAELAKQKALAEAKAREEAEHRAREEAEAARARAEQEAARIRAELEAAKAKAEAEAKAREEAEHKARKEAERKAQEEAERKAREEAERKAQEEAERKAQEEAERKAQEEAERKAQEEAERKAQEEAERKAQEEAERKAQEEAERKAQEEAERKAREEAERKAQEEAERKAKEEAERKAQEEAERKAQEEAERKAQEEAERKAQEEAERKAQEEAERKAREEADAKAREEADAARAKAEAEVKAREEAEAELKVQQKLESPKSRTGAYQTARSTSATVLFFDVVGYTKLPVNKQYGIKEQFNQLVTECLDALEEGERIILDTGDGAAIGFLQHPEDALEVATRFRKTVMANQHKDYPELNVRIGIHLGPINVVKDMNGQSNMVGDGINDAQRVMSFAGIDQIYVSRPYYDFISRLNDEYASLFQYRGLQKDKHGREHPVYELMDAAAPVAQAELPQGGEPEFAIKLEPFSFAMPEAAAPPVTPEAMREEPEPESQQQPQEAAPPVNEIEQFKFSEEAAKPAEAEPAGQEQPSQANAPETPHEAAAQPAAKPAAEAYMPSAEEVAKLAEAQAKTWAEAERRSAEAARVSAAKPQENRRTEKEAPPVERARRKPLPLGKIGAGLFVVLLVALFAVPPLMPTKDYVAAIEQQLAEKLQQPVHIGQLTGRLLPTPRMELKDVSIGEGRAIQAQQAQVDFALSALFSSTKPIDSIELDGVQANGAALQQASAWLQQIASDPQHPVARIVLSQGKLDAGSVQLSGIGGELEFDQAGKFAQARLRAEGGKFALDIAATPENRMQVSIAVRGSALPLLPNWVFDELDAKGELTGDGLVVTEMDSRIMGGILLGNARIDWHSGWRAEGSLTAKTITLQNMSNALTGDMDGTARFQMQSENLAGLADTATLEGAFAIRKGVIAGVDVIETARLRSKENLPGGRTHFDELSGDLYYADGSYHFRKVKMSTGVLNASATVDIARQKISGRVIADLTMRSGMGSVVLQVGGTTDNPTLQAVR